MASVEAIDYLASPAKHPVRPVCALFGDQAFLQREALVTLRRQVAPEADGDFSIATLDGETVELVQVLDELATIAMFGGGGRLVIVENADNFVSRHRAALEQYAARPKGSSTLALVVRSWPANTRLAKQVAEAGLAIECKAPTPARLAKWLVRWAKQRHGATLTPDAADALVEQVEPELGLLDQELAKLAAVAGPGVEIDDALVTQAVGGWRTKTVWELLDAALEGQTATALAQLDRLLLAGEAPIALLGQVASNLRRFAAAVRFVEQTELTGRRTNLRSALQQAGVKPFVLAKAEGQMRRLGRERAGKLYRWLLEADLALKGSSSSPARGRLLLEQFVVRLAAGGQT
jgi:DNA polymerase-3 subunit delta